MSWWARLKKSAVDLWLRFSAWVGRCVRACKRWWRHPQRAPLRTKVDTDLQLLVLRAFRWGLAVFCTWLRRWIGLVLRAA